LGEEFVREGAEGGSLSLGGVEWSGDAHAGFVDLRREGWAERRKNVVAGSIHARCCDGVSALIYNHSRTFKECNT
jgi:hypothetical protein